MQRQHQILALHQQSMFYSSLVRIQQDPKVWLSVAPTEAKEMGSAKWFYSAALFSSVQVPYFLFLSCANNVRVPI